jgi:hypothetical protein
MELEYLVVEDSGLWPSKLPPTDTHSVLMRNLQTKNTGLGKKIAPRAG